MTISVTGKTHLGGPEGAGGNQSAVLCPAGESGSPVPAPRPMRLRLNLCFRGGGADYKLSFRNEYEHRRRGTQPSRPGLPAPGPDQACSASTGGVPSRGTNRAGAASLSGPGEKRYISRA